MILNMIHLISVGIEHFSLFGRQLMNERCFVHFGIPHNIAPSYAKRNKDNKIIFERLIRRFDKENYMPPALSGDSYYYDGKSLILSPFNGKLRIH